MGSTIETICLRAEPSWGRPQESRLSPHTNQGPKPPSCLQSLRKKCIFSWTLRKVSWIGAKEKSQSTTWSSWNSPLTSLWSQSFSPNQLFLLLLGPGLALKPAPLPNILCFLSQLHPSLNKTKSSESVQHASLGTKGSPPRVCDSMDCSLTGCSVHGIFQARILEWVAMSSSRGSLKPGIEPRSLALWAGYLPSEPPRKPPPNIVCNIS